MIDSQVARMQKNRASSKINGGKYFPPIQEIYLEFLSSSLTFTESNRKCFLNSFHVFLSDFIPFIFKKSGFDAESMKF